MFITFEGIDGSGKSTQAALLASYLEAQGFDVLRLREPGGTSLSEKIRALLLDPAGTVNPMAELLLYEASRAQLVRGVIAPALARDAMVVCDRFADSTMAYQWAGRGLDGAAVAMANDLACQGVVPDLTIVLDMEPEVAYGRACQGGMDRMEAEGLAFQARVRQGYLTLATREPQRIRVVDASGDEEAVEAIVQALVEAHLSNHGRTMGGGPRRG